MTGRLDETNIEMDLNCINCMNDLHLGDDKYCKFIKHLNKDTARHYLVAISQDERFTDERCENLSLVDLDLQMKLTRLCSELSSKQQLRLAEIIRLVMQSMNEQDANDALCAFTNVLLTDKTMQRMCLRSKTSMAKNIPSPKSAM